MATHPPAAGIVGLPARGNKLPSGALLRSKSWGDGARSGLLRATLRAVAGADLIRLTVCEDRRGAQGWFGRLRRVGVSMRFHPKSRESMDQRPGPNRARAAPTVPAIRQTNGCWPETSA